MYMDKWSEKNQMSQMQAIWKDFKWHNMQKLELLGKYVNFVYRLWFIVTSESIWGCF